MNTKEAIDQILIYLTGRTVGVKRDESVAEVNPNIVRAADIVARKRDKLQQDLLMHPRGKTSFSNERWSQ